MSRSVRSEGLFFQCGPDDQGHDQRLLLTILKTDVGEHGATLENTLCRATVDDAMEPISCIPQCLHVDPVSDAPLTLNFVRFKKGRKVSFPVQFFNSDLSPGLKRGGYINFIHRTVPCEVHSEVLPRSLGMDLTGLNVGSRIRLCDLGIPDSVRSDMYPQSGHDFRQAW
jgi:large subunit ribosomal protein L25